MIFLVSLFVWSFRNLANFSLIWRHHHYRGRAANFDLAFDLAVRGSSTCRTYFDRWHPYIRVISEDPWHLTCCGTFCSGSVITYFHYLALSRLGFEQPTLRMPGERSNRLRHRCGDFVFYLYLLWQVFDNLNSSKYYSSPDFHSDEYMSSKRKHF